jgi:hypothetical protein
MNNFSATIPGTKGESGPKSPPRRHPGDKPLSLNGQEYKALLERETDASIRLDVARYGEVRRWDWKTLGETKHHQANAGTEKFQGDPEDQPAL